METSKDANIPIPALIVLYDFRYTWKDSREICVKKGEKLLLLEKTNKDWWQVVRPTERKSFFVPAQYVELIVREKQETGISGSSSGANYDDSVLYENLDSLKQQVDLPSLSNVRKSDAVTSSKFAKDEKEKKSLQDAVKQKPVPKTRTKVSASKSSEEISDSTKSTAPNAKYSYLERIESDMLDKSDKSKIGDKKTKDFILSLPKESNTSGGSQGDKNYRGKGAPVAIENLVYCNVPLGKGNNLVGKSKGKASDVENQLLVGVGKNRMKNSYNLKSKPVLERQAPSGRTEIKQCAEKEKSKLNQNFSKSLEKLAEEIQFEPKKVSVGSKSLSADNCSKTKAAKMPNSEKKQERKGKTNDTSLVLDENKIQPQSRSVFSRFRRSLHHSSSFKSNNLKKLGKNSKKACELSLSWEGGLDKIQEKKESEEKPQATPLGLQRSRTFMFAERSPLSMRPANKIFSGKHRLDTAYHSQRKPEEKVTFSTFKPIFNLDVSQQSPDPVKKGVAKEINKHTLEREKFQGKEETEDDVESQSKCSAKSKPSKTGPGTKSAYVNVGNVYHSAESETRNKSPGREGLTFYNEPYSNSESEDNLEEKSLATIAYKSLRSQSSIESNVTVSEGTDPSESDENGSLDFKLEKRNQFSDQVVSKRRTSLVRSSRVESSKVRKVTARLPPTPPPEQKPTKVLGEGWGAYVSKGGRSYYYNEKTGEKNWKPPRRTINAQEKRLGSHESVCSDVNRSGTSSPLNENCHLLNSLNRSNGSLHSKSGQIMDNSSFDTTKSGSLPLWKEDSPDDLNRSSYNSSPITGLSQSSTYSLNKSSRDSLNRFSPIENIPSEEEGLELHDHVYQDDRKEQTKSEVERRSKCSERMDTSTFRIKLGWEEFYDENLEQIYYMYKDRKEKCNPGFKMLARKFNFIPQSVALWLQDIRKAAEDYEETENPQKDKSQEMNSSNDSIYDNVEQRVPLGIEDVSSRAARSEEKEKRGKKLSCSTWPLRRYPGALLTRSLKNVVEYMLMNDGAKTWFRLNDENQRIIHFNWLRSKLTTIKRVLNSSDIIYGRRDLGDRRVQEGGEPIMFASMSNLLACHREKHTQECVWTWLNESVEVKDFSQSTSEEDLFSEILNNIKNDIIDFEKRMTYIQRESQSVTDSFKLQGFFGILEPRDFTRDFTRKSLPANFAPSDASSERGFVTEKPPLAPKRRKHRMDRNYRSPGAQNRRARKTHLAKVKAVAIPTVEPRTKTSDSRETKGEEDTKSELSVGSVLEIATDNEDEGPDSETKKPLPFPAYNPELEYEINELLMMQRVTESSKERRRISTERKTFPVLEEPSHVQGFVKNIPGRTSPISAPVPDWHSDFTKVICDMVGEDVDAEGRSKVKEFLEFRKKKAKFQVEAKIPLKLREDVIIDWENDYENLNEPVVLEGKSIASKRSPSLRLRNQVHLNDYLKSSIAQMPRDFSDDETNTIKMDQHVDIFDLASASSSDEISSLVSDTTLTRSKVLEPNRAKLPKTISRSKITDIVTRCDKILKQNDPKSDTETFDKISVSSISDGLNSYSDFESDMNETLAVGEMWCNEKSSDENISLISWDVSEDASKSVEGLVDDDLREDSESRKCCEPQPTAFENKCPSFDTSPAPSDGRLDTIVEDDEKITEKRNSSALYPKIKWKSASETNLLNCTKAPPTIETKLSKSLDFFRDSLTDTRLEPVKTARKHDSITSDVCEWMARIRGIAFAEDRLFSDDDEWILSFDSEERAYFFEETSKKSLWALPDYPSEDTRPEFNFSIQRSATESAISNDSIAKLRIGKDGGKSGRISASTRSSKAQSMLIEPKFDLSKDGSKTYSMPRDLSKIYGEIIRFGVLNKTKISENGKKLRKNWTPAFVVLTESYLFFFKDAKSFQNMKNVISPNVNHMCLSLQGAVIEKGDKISSRKNVYKISCSDNTDVLIQTDKTPEAEEWFKKISLIIQNLPQDTLAVSGSPVLDLNSPSKVGRTKSLKVRSKESGSMEDLSSTPEERQNKIKARLKKFFIRRPTVDSLKKKGIWKDEPVFGCSLEQITKNRNPRVPIFVEKCIECIESKEENMKTDGLYRASGNLSQVQKIRLEVDQNNLSIMKDEEDVHVLTGSLKLFFRELKEPLIPSKQLEPALLATDKQLRKERIKDFQKIVRSLPTPNYDTLKFLLQHLLRVKEYHKFNRMNINNLAIVFGPTLMWPEQESANMALELMQQNVVIECLLKEFQEIFA